MPSNYKINLTTYLPHTHETVVHGGTTKTADIAFLPHEWLLQWV